MPKINYVTIEGTIVSTDDKEITEEDFWPKFIDFVESNNWGFNGITKDSTDKSNKKDTDELQFNDKFYKKYKDKIVRNDNYGIGIMVGWDGDYGNDGIMIAKQIGSSEFKAFDKLSHMIIPKWKTTDKSLFFYCTIDDVIPFIKLTKEEKELIINYYSSLK